VEPSPAEQAAITAVRRARLFVFLRLRRHELFDEEFQGELAEAYADRPKCLPPARLALATILQAYTRISDDEVIEATVMDRRLQLALDCLGAEEPPFSKGTLVSFRARLIEHDLDRRLAERTVALAAQAKGFGARALRAALDSSPLWGAGRVEDTFNLMGHAAQGPGRGRGRAGAGAGRRDRCRGGAGGGAAAGRLQPEGGRLRTGTTRPPGMRRWPKSRSVLFDGYKRHVLRDLDTGLIPAAGITAANAPEARVTGDIETDLEAAGWHLSELHIDRAYLSSALVRDRGPDLAIFCKAWRVRNTGGRLAKNQFTLDFDTGR
jgi:transposase